MALTINPTVSRGHPRFLLHSVAFFLGTIVGGLVSLLAMLAVVAALGLVAPAHALPLLVLPVIAWAVLRDLGLPLPMPYRHAQVPEWLREVLPTSAIAATYGLMLGVGFVTLFTYSAQLAMLLALPFLGSLGAMILVVTLFALGKTTVLMAGFGAVSFDHIANRFVWSAHRIRVLKLSTAFASTALAVVLALSV
jgi:hypothetical protein